jgi:hypothetical protein
MNTLIDWHHHGLVLILRSTTLLNAYNEYFMYFSKKHLILKFNQ